MESSINSAHKPTAIQAVNTVTCMYEKIKVVIGDNDKNTELYQSFTEASALTHISLILLDSTALEFRPIN